MLVTRREKRYNLDADGVTFFQRLRLDFQSQDRTTKANSIHIDIFSTDAVSKRACGRD